MSSNSLPADLFQGSFDCILARQLSFLRKTPILEKIPTHVLESSIKWCFSHVLEIPSQELWLQTSRPLSQQEQIRLQNMLLQLAEGVPLEYVLGQMKFYGCLLTVDPRVLIPRQETEILVDLILQRLGKNRIVAWDVCCGSGCLGIALKKTLPHLEMTLADLSSQALEVARKNARANQVEARFVQGDLLLPFKGEKADLILCNPPYVSSSEYASLDPSLYFEPKMALLAVKTGLEYYIRLAEMLPFYLKPGALVCLEIGASQGQQVKNIFSSISAACQLLKDWSGHDRFFFLELEEGLD